MIQTSIARCKKSVLRYLPNDKFIGMSLELYGEFSDIEAGMLEQLLRPGQVVVEVGANIGAHTVRLSQFVGETGRVLAIEPQREVYAILAENLRTNGCANAVPIHAAAGASCGMSMVPAVDYDQVGNFGGVELDTGLGECVPRLTLDSMGLDRVDLLKIDVEGMELAVIKGALNTIRACRPILYVENDRADKSAALIAAIVELGYDIWWHLPPMFNPNNTRGNKNNIFPGIVSINMVCVPSEKKARIALCKVAGPDDNWRRANAATHFERRQAVTGEKKAAVIRPGAYGDVIIVSSILPHLKEQGYHVTVYTEERGEEVLRHDPHVDNVIMYHGMPSRVAVGFWDDERQKYDRVINLTESLEKNAIASEFELRFYWPDQVRRRYYGTTNYLELTHAIAEVPASRPEDFRQRFYPSADEAAWAKRERAAIDSLVVGIAVSGSSPTKFWPHVREFAEQLAADGVTVMLFGELGELKDAKASDRVRLIGTTWPLRKVLAFLQLCDGVVGQETGMLNAVAMEAMPKVVLLTHSNTQNLTRRWINTDTIFGPAPCWPCHRIHHHMGFCTADKNTGKALCQALIQPGEVLKLLRARLVAFVGAAPTVAEPA